MVNHIQPNFNEIVAEIIRWNEIMRGVYEFKPTFNIEKLSYGNPKSPDL